MWHLTRSTITLPLTFSIKAMRRFILDYLAFWLSMVEWALRPLFKVQWYKSYVILLMLRRMAQDDL